MFDELEKYKKKNHFFLTVQSEIKEVCNAPDKPGVYLVYAIIKGKRELVYVGYTKADLINKRQVTVSKKKASTVILQTLSEEIIKTISLNQIGNIGWKEQMRKEKVTAIDVHWFVTVDKDFEDLPEDVERLLMQKYIHLQGQLPSWNSF